MQWLAKKNSTLFNVLFVMMEGLESEFREMAWRKTCLLFFIDFFQLLRILTLPIFGWSNITSGFLEKFDVVYDFTLLGSMVVPRYSFFILSFVLVTFALVETAYVARIFEKGSVKQMWPVKVLRFLVVMMVTTLFSSLLKWLLIPFACLVSNEDSFSQEIHGEGTSCDPFRFPEILATIPTIMVAMLYITFAFITTTFNLQVNVLSRAPGAASTGRVEILFLTNKVAATCFTLVCNVISPTVVAAVLLVISLTVFRFHTNILPFHHHPTNVLRGGIYGASSWAALSSTVVSLNDNLTLQWTMIALLPVAFLFGMVAVHWSRRRMFGALDRLRGEWEQRKSYDDLQRAAALLSDNPSGSQHTHDSSAEEEQHGEVEDDSSGQVARHAKAGLARFFDRDGEKRRIFVSGQHAEACARVLLHRRRAEDRPFLQYVIERGLEDFRDYRPLRAFRILTFSMVLERPCVASAEKKQIEESGESLPMDLEYLLHCFERKAMQAMAAQNLGKQRGGQISAINLMEFNLGLTKAKQAHANALQAIKGCWKNVYRLAERVHRTEKLRGLGREGEAGRRGGKHHGHQGVYEEVVGQLEEYSALTREAKHEYSALLYKFPSSVELLFSYATFLDVCMNESREADAKRSQAVLLQARDEEGGDEEGGGAEEAERRGRRCLDEASVTSGSDCKRKVTQRFVAGWEHRIMGAESRQLRQLVRRVKLATLLLVVSATAAFVVSDFILFRGMTKAEIHRIKSIGELYTLAVGLAHTTRHLLLGAWHSPDRFAAVQGAGRAEVAELRRRHVSLHSEVDFAEADAFFNQRLFTMLVPTVGGWKRPRYTLWEAGGKYATGAELAYAATEAEVKNASYDVQRMSEEKRNVVFVMANTLTMVVPTLEELQIIYVREMEQIQHTADLLASVNASVNAALVVLISLLVLRGLSSVCHRMESRALMCELMASLPHRTARRIYDFYRQAEQALQVLEDDDDHHNDLLSTDGDPDLRGRGSPGKASFSPTRALAGPPARRCSLKLLQRAMANSHAEEFRMHLDRPASWTDRDPSASPAPASSTPRHLSLLNSPAGSAAGGKARREPLGECGTVVLPLTAHNLEIQEGLEVTSGPGAQRAETLVRHERRGVGPTAQVGGEGPRGPVVQPGDDGGKREEGKEEEAEAAGVGWEMGRSGILVVRRSPGESRGGDRAGDGSVKKLAKEEGGGEGKEGSGLGGFVGLRAIGGEDFARKASGRAGRRVSVSESVNDEPTRIARSWCTDNASADALTLDRGAAMAEEVRVALRQRRVWFLRTQTWAVVFAVVLGLCLVSTILATRDFSHLIELAPIVREAGRRLMLVKAGAFFARELVLDDGFSRMSRQELSDGLLFVLDQTRLADRALRLGDPSRGVSQGADVRNRLHNRVMYSNSCPWTPQPAGTCADPAKPSVGEGGLLAVLTAFENALETVLHRYGLPADAGRGEELMTYRDESARADKKEGLGAMEYTVQVRAERLARLAEDSDVAYAVQSFDGYLAEGLGFVLGLLDRELDAILEEAIRLNEVLFALYLVAVVVVFWWLLFRRVIAYAQAEAQAAQALVRRMPLHVLAQSEVDGIADFFRDDDDDDATDHDAAAPEE